MTESAQTWEDRYGAGAQNAPPSPLDADTIAKLLDMDKTQLIALIMRVAGAMWGIGLKTQEETKEAARLRLANMALTSADDKITLAAIAQLLDRLEGKPQQVQVVDMNVNAAVSHVMMPATKRFMDELLGRTQHMVDDISECESTNMAIELKQ